MYAFLVGKLGIVLKTGADTGEMNFTGAEVTARADCLAGDPTGAGGDFFITAVAGSGAVILMGLFALGRVIKDGHGLSETSLELLKGEQ